MSGKGRVTNNSVSSLEEQSDVLSEVFSKADSDHLAKMSEKEKKKLLRRKKELELAKALEESKKAKTIGSVPVTKSSAPVTQATSGVATSVGNTTTSTTTASAAAGSSGMAASLDDSVDSEEDTSANGGLTWSQIQTIQARAQAQAQAQALQMSQFGNFVPNFTFGLGAPPQWGLDWSQFNDRPTHAVSEAESDVESQLFSDEPLVIAPVDTPQLKSTGLLAEFCKEQLTNVKESEKVAPKITEDLAVVLNKILSESIYPADMDKLTKIHPRVENVEFMKVPRLDSEIYEAIDQKVRNFDQGIQNIQKAIMGAVSAFAPILRLVYERQETDQELNSLGRQLGEGVKLLGYASNNLSVKRRELIKPNIDAKYAKTLSKGHDANPEWLFGGDLVNTTRKCEVSQKISEKVLKRKVEASQNKGPRPKKFKGNKGPAMMRGFNPFQMQGFRFPGPQMFQPYPAQQSMGFPMGYQRPFRPRNANPNQPQSQGFPKKQNMK